MPLTYGSASVQKTAVQSFWNSYYTYPDPFADLTYTRPSDQLTDTYTWLGAAPMPQEWKGDKEAKAANEYSYPVTNKPWEATVKVEKHLIKFQQWDLIGGLVGNLGEKARMHKIKMATAVLDAGFATVCEDGQFFFDTDHKSAGAAYSTNQTNMGTANATDATAPTAVEFAAALRTLYNNFYAFKDDQGDPAVPSSSDPADWIVMVPPGFYSVAEKVLRSNTLTTAGDNDLTGRYTIRVNPWITAPVSTHGFFYLFNTALAHKPLVIQEASGIELDDTMKGDEAFLSGDIMYSAGWWGNVVAGQWRAVCGYDFT